MLGIGWLNFYLEMVNSLAEENYLKAIFKLQQDRSAVSTSEIAARMRISAASATSMVKRLARLRLVAYTPYRGFALTSAGERIASRGSGITVCSSCIWPSTWA